MRRLAAAMVIPVLAIVLATVFAPHAPGGEAAGAVTVAGGEGVLPAVKSAIEIVARLLSSVGEWAAVL